MDGKTAIYKHLALMLVYLAQKELKHNREDVNDYFSSKQLLYRK